MLRRNDSQSPSDNFLRFGLQSFAEPGVPESPLEELVLIPLCDRFISVLVELGGVISMRDGTNGRHGDGRVISRLMYMPMNIWMLPMTCTLIMFPAWCAISVRRRFPRLKSRRSTLNDDIGRLELERLWQAASDEFVVGTPWVKRHSRPVSHRPCDSLQSKWQFRITVCLIHRWYLSLPALLDSG